MAILITLAIVNDFGTFGKFYVQFKTIEFLDAIHAF